MIPSPRSPEVPLTRWEQVLLVLCGLGGLTLLLMAMWLQPDPRGFGTHRQLGLPPCTFKVLFDIPCPSCGGTTAFALFVRGRWVEALRSNAAAGLLAGLCALGVPWVAGSVWHRRYLGLREPLFVFVVILGSLAVISLTQWGCRLMGWIP